MIRIIILLSLDFPLLLLYNRLFMAATTHLMTVEEFRKLPEDSGPVYHELGV